MSLFEKLKNKRYDLQEKKEKFDPAAELLKAIRNRSERDAARDFQKDVGKDITPELKADQNRFFTDKSDSDTLKTKTTGDEGQFRRNAKKQQPLVSKDIRQSIPRKSKKITVGALQARDKAISAFDKQQLMITAKPGEAAKTKRLISKKIKNITAPKEGEVEKAKKIVKKINTKAQDYTDKINQQNKNRPEGRKRQYYKGRKAERAKYTDGLSRDQRIANIKADIDKRDTVKKLERTYKKEYKANRLKQRTIQKKLRIDKAIARSGESSIKFRDTARTIAKKIPGFTKTITTPAVANKAGKVITPAKTKTALKPVVKKGIQLVQKAGPAGAIAAGTGLALLNPSIRKTVKKVATGALAAAGVKAFMPKPKKVERPPSKIGINLSPKA
tara:strand:- start:53 stop:1213 length:1161 start_codon:yes stop_codon:yes gene_type:complete